MDDPKVTAEELVQELLNRVAQLTMELAASAVLIRRLREEPSEMNGQKELVSLEKEK